MTSHRTLRLSYQNGLICGVCGGIAECIGWRPNAVRILYVLLSVLSAGFPGMLVYALLYLIMPGPALATVPKRGPRNDA